jgi:hypothetical protein
MTSCVLLTPVSLLVTQLRINSTYIIYVAPTSIAPLRRLMGRSHTIRDGHVSVRVSKCTARGFSDTLIAGILNYL